MVFMVMVDMATDTKNVARNHRSKWKVRACMCFMSQPQV